MTLKDINDTTREGRLLIAALSIISTESRRDQEPASILDHVKSIAVGIYGGFIEDQISPEPPQTFERLLATAINKFSRENGSNTPDFILAEYLATCLEAFDKTSRAREKWYGKSLSLDKPNEDAA